MTFDIVALLETLALNRPLFHSEADFQHALALHISKILSETDVRLEIKPFPHRRIYLDIWVPGFGTAIELKYKTRSLTIDSADEVYTLRNQAAQGFGRYDFLKDVMRLEDVVSSWEMATAGVAVLLTNDSSYWKDPSGKNTDDSEFRLYEGRQITGKLVWSDRAASGTIKGREKRIELKGLYKLKWRDYSDLGHGSYRRFRYLAIDVMREIADSNMPAASS